MLFDDNIEIFQGVWTDWENGGMRIFTASPRTSQILASFLSVFITFAGTRLWYLVAFALHQCRDSNRSQDGLHHQRQAILRNSVTATNTAFQLVQQAIAWRGLAKGNFRRSLTWVVLVLTYAIGSGLIAVFTASEIALNSQSRRLVRPASYHGLMDSNNCGFLNVNETSSQNDEEHLIVGLYDVHQAAGYARECYNNTGRGINANCKLFSQPSIPWKKKTNAQCPFAPEVCRSNALAFEADTGLISARSYLGINGRDSDTLQYRKVVTCIPLAIGDYQVLSKVGPSGDDTLVSYQYGRMGPEAVKNLITAQQIQRAFNLGYDEAGVPFAPFTGDGVPYHIETRRSVNGQAEAWPWTPIKELNRTDADVSLILIAPNDMFSFNPIDDPVFSAHTQVLTWPLKQKRFRFDNALSPIACTTQFQICNPVNSKCSSLSSRNSLWPVHPKSRVGSELDYPADWTVPLKLNRNQRSVALRLWFGGSNLDDAVAGRGASALLANQFTYGTYQTQLSETHWHDEVATWFNITLALEQLRMQEFALPRRERYSTSPLKQVKKLPAGTEWMCETQTTSITNGTVNFRYWGLIAVFAVGSAIIVASFVHEKVAWCLYRWFRRESTAGRSRRLWVQDGLLQLQRMALQKAALGTWKATEKHVPTTAKGEVFYRYGDSGLEMPLVPMQRRTDVIWV